MQNANTTIFTSTGAVQTYTVAVSGTYDILALGAKGGNSQATGGAGATVDAKIYLSKGTSLGFVVGGSGNNGLGSYYGGGGGGGTFVFIDVNRDGVPDAGDTLLLAAGGGGGGGVAYLFGSSTSTGKPGVGITGVGLANASLGTAGYPGYFTTGGSGGTEGLGGQASSPYAGQYYQSGGGAGWNGSGGGIYSSDSANGGGGNSKPSFLGGGSPSGGDGGFGGGGGASPYGGGGGGGYNGGGGGAVFAGGGGGGSYLISSATLVSSVSGGNTSANGSAALTLLAAANTGKGIPSNILINTGVNNFNFTNTILTNKTVFPSVAGDYCVINVISGSGYCGNINTLITINDLVLLSNPSLKSQGLLSNGEQILPECILTSNIITSFIKPIANSIHYCFAAGLANNSNLILQNDYSLTPYLTDCVVINTLTNCVANLDVNNFGGILITGYGVSVTGLNTNNHLMAAGGGTYTCGPGNITLYLNGGNAIAQGGSGIDTVVMQGQQYNPLVINTIIKNQTSTSQIYSDKGLSTLTNVEYLQFDNQTVAIGVGAGQNAGEVYRLYQAAFNRTPDQGGLCYWIKLLDTGTAITSVANAFINSTEFVKSYGNNLSNSALVNALYTNILHRAPDAAGANYWLATLDKNTSSNARADLLVNFSESAENIGNVATLIANGIPLGDYKVA